MMLIRITGSQLHAARVLVGLSREEVAERAGRCRHSRRWFRVCGTQSGILIRVPIARETAKRLAEIYSFCITLMCRRRTAAAGSCTLSACSANSK
jgi:hypothetical protein